MGQLSRRLVNRINNRLLSFENMGLSDSKQYNYIKEQIGLLGAGTKGGKNRVSETFTDVSQLGKLLNVSTARQIMTNTRRQMQKETGQKPTADEVKRRINETGKLESWISNNLDSIYENKGDLPQAQFLYDMLESGLRNYDYGQIWSRIHDFENARDAWESDPTNSESQFRRFTSRFDENDFRGFE